MRIKFERDIGQSVDSVGELCASNVSGDFAASHARAISLLTSRTIRRFENSCSALVKRHDVVVAVPVRNEIERIGACVRALNTQARGKRTIKALFLVNNSGDGTAEWLIRNLPACSIAAEVIQVQLPRSEQTAGRARWFANHAALEMTGANRGALFMTDADSIVPPRWIEHYAAMLDRGWDAVAGTVEISDRDRDQIVASLDHRGRLESCYTALIDELESRIDPVSHDPWPRHFNASGANIAARVAAIRRLDDFPSIACGEDRAFIQAMEARDLRVRHDLSAPVRTSGRLFGRAQGGMADTLRYRTHVPNSPCDERLESAERTYLRALLRATWRRFHVDLKPERGLIRRFAKELDVPLPVIASAAAVETFGASWQTLETNSPRLLRQPVVPSLLPIEIKRATDLLETVRCGALPKCRETGLGLRA